MNATALFTDITSYRNSLTTSRMRTNQPPNQPMLKTKLNTRIKTTNPITPVPNEKNDMILKLAAQLSAFAMILKQNVMEFPIPIPHEMSRNI